MALWERRHLAGGRVDHVVCACGFGFEDDKAAALLRDEVQDEVTDDVGKKRHDLHQGRATWIVR